MIDSNPLKSISIKNLDIQTQTTKKAPFYEPQSLMDRDNMVEFSDEEEFQRHERAKSIATLYSTDSQNDN